MVDRLSPRLLPSYKLNLENNTEPRILLDPFCGSGVSLRVARSMGHDAVGIEAIEAVAEIARDYGDQNPVCV